MPNTISPTTIGNVLIAILPFRPGVVDEPLDLFFSGLSEDLITDLSRFGGLEVISSYSTNQLRLDREEDREIISSLGADYLVTGTYRAQSGRLKVNIQLLETDTMRVVWAENFNSLTSSLIELEDQMVEQIVSALQIRINANLLNKTRKKPITNLAAYEYWLRGNEALQKGTLESDLEARRFFEQALEKDPHYARAYTGLSLSYFNEWSCQLWERWDESQKGALEYALKAVALDEYDHVSLGVLGRLYLYKGDFEKAEHCLRKALRTNANDADNLILIASCFCFMSYKKEAEKLYRRALKLNPVNVHWYHTYGCFIYFELGQYEKAIEDGLKTQDASSWVDLPAFIGAAYYHLGHEEEANKYWQKFLKNYDQKVAKGQGFDEKLAATWVRTINPFLDHSPLFPYLDEKGAKPYEEPNSTTDSTTQKPSFLFEGNLWYFSFKGKSQRIADAKGFHDIKRLISEPGEEIHCTELMGATLQLTNEVMVLDEKAKKEYQNRIIDIQAALTEADTRADYVQTERLQEEYDQLLQQLSGALGLAGKSRKAKSPVERSRSAVTWRIRSAIKKIDTVLPELATHLNNAIKTGTFCVYRPEEKLEWILNDG